MVLVFVKYNYHSPAVHTVTEKYYFEDLFIYRKPDRVFHIFVILTISKID